MQKVDRWMERSQQQYLMELEFKNGKKKMFDWDNEDDEESEGDREVLPSVYTQTYLQSYKN